MELQVLYLPLLIVRVGEEVVGICLLLYTVRIVAVTLESAGNSAVVVVEVVMAELYYVGVVGVVGVAVDVNPVAYSVLLHCY